MTLCATEYCQPRPSAPNGTASLHTSLGLQSRGHRFQLQTECLHQALRDYQVAPKCFCLGIGSRATALLAIEAKSGWRARYPAVGAARAALVQVERGTGRQPSKGKQQPGDGEVIHRSVDYVHPWLASDSMAASPRASLQRNLAIRLIDKLGPDHG